MSDKLTEFFIKEVENINPPSKDNPDLVWRQTYSSILRKMATEPSSAFPQNEGETAKK